MDLKLWSLPAANDWLMVSINPKISSVDVIDEVSKAVLDSH